MRACVWLVSILLQSFLAAAYAEDFTRDESHPLVLHAEGRLALHEGRYEEALGLFRKAHRSDPHDKQIAYDLAQAALAFQTPQFKEDVAAFMALPPSSVPTWVLHAKVAYVLGDTKNYERASKEARALGYQENLGVNNTHVEHVPQTPVAVKKPLKHVFSGRFKTLLGYDSNLNVWPDTASSKKGVQSTLDAMVSYALSHEKWVLHVLAGTVFAPYLSREAEVRLYNMGLSYAQLAFKIQHGDFNTMLQAGASTVYINDYRSHFMDSLRFYTEERYTGYAVKPALYASVDVRDFGYFNAEHQTMDRDGTRGELGLTADYARGVWKNTAVLGWQMEQSQGSYFREQGFKTRFQTGLEWEKVSLFTSVNHESRFHQSSSDAGVEQDAETSHIPTVKRVDHRVTYDVTASFFLYAHTRVYMSYMYVHNFSNTLFKYQRNVAQLGIELRF